MSCAAGADSFLDARLAGDIDAAIHWQGAEVDCDGMRRPDGLGLRVTFSGTQAGQRLTLVFGVPHLAEGATERAVPVNVTVIREGGAVYGTRGDGKCLLDEVRQAAVAAKPDAGAAATRQWRIEARGFCLEPARSIGDARDAILLSTFDFRGQLTWEPDPPASAPLKSVPNKAAP